MDPQQQFCLKWNSYSSNLAMTFSNLFKSELLADVTLFCGGTVFKAHKLILAACSKNFAELFETAPSSSSCMVILEATSADNMAALLEFMYKGEVHVSQEALNGFLKAAENLQVKGLSTEHAKLAVPHSHSHDDCPMDGGRSPSPSNDGGGHHHHHHSQHHNSGNHGGHGSHHLSHHHSQQQQHHHSQHQHHGHGHNSRSTCASPSPAQHGGCSLRAIDGESVTMHPSTSITMAQFPQYMSSIANMPTMGGMATMSLASMYQPQSHRPISFEPSGSGSSGGNDGNGGGNGGGGGGGAGRSGNGGGSSGRKRTQRSPAYNEPECSRQSVLRDGSRSSAEDCSPGSKGYRPASNASSNAPIECETVHSDRMSPPLRYDNPSPSTSAAANGSVIAQLNDNNDSNHHSRSPHDKQVAGSSRNSNSAGAQDLRVKLETYESPAPQPSTSSSLSMCLGTPSDLVNFIEKNSGEAGLSASLVASIKPADMLTVWNQTKMNQKGGTVNTADGKKLKCLYCDRLYGYETNLRAHIRQRHQGIRVPCPFCSRTFTRNNTVRRHIAREHKHELGLSEGNANETESPTPTDEAGPSGTSPPTPSTSSASPNPVQATPQPTAMQTS